MTYHQPITAPVLFLVFNRPEHSRKAFERIRLVRPLQLFIAGDGPRRHVPSDHVNCRDVRLLADQVDWECDVRTLFQTENVGCENAVTAAITWFFDHIDSGIILEDDCVASASFFDFCEAMLKRYESDHRIGAITGNNFQQGKIRTQASYYFSKYPHCWGWATWKRSWALYNFEMGNGRHTSDADIVNRFAKASGELVYWSRLFQQVRRGLINTWDYRWVHSLWKHQLLTVTPELNLVRNIGFDKSGTHTLGQSDWELPIETSLPTPYMHPETVCQHVDADEFIANNVMNVPRSIRHRMRWELGVIADRFSFKS